MRAHSIRSIIESIHRTKQEVHCQLLHRDGKELTPTEWTILVTIDNQKDISTKELAAKLGVSTSAISQMLKVLQQNKYITKSKNPTDKRSSFMRTTAKAKKILTKMNKETERGMAKLFKPLTDKELQTLAKLHNKISEAISK